MHDTVVEMKDGRTFCGPIWEFRPHENYFTLIDQGGEEPITIRFSDIKSAVTATERRGPADELKRARDTIAYLRRTGQLEDPSIRDWEND